MVSSNVLLDSIQIEIGGDNEWPNDAKLFQPYETEQILMPDSANCLAVQAFLQMANLKYETVYKANAAEMSPTGRVPFIKVGQYLVAELEPIVAFVQNKNISLTSNLTDAEKSDMRAYMSLINTVFGNAENYITWCDPETYSKVTKKRFGSIHPFPLNHILVWKKRSATIERMKALGGKTEQEAVLDDVDLCCQSLSDRLGDREFFFKSGPTELDCLLFAHVTTVLSWPHFKIGNLLAQTILKYPKLIHHSAIVENCLRVTESSSFSIFSPILKISSSLCSSLLKEAFEPEDGRSSGSSKGVIVAIRCPDYQSSANPCFSSENSESAKFETPCWSEYNSKLSDSKLKPINPRLEENKDCSNFEQDFCNSKQVISHHRNGSRSLYCSTILKESGRIYYATERRTFSPIDSPELPSHPQLSGTYDSVMDATHVGSTTNRSSLSRVENDNKSLLTHTKTKENSINVSTSTETLNKYVGSCKSLPISTETAGQLIGSFESSPTVTGTEDGSVRSCKSLPTSTEIVAKSIESCLSLPTAVETVTVFSKSSTDSTIFPKIVTRSIESCQCLTTCTEQVDNCVEKCKNSSVDRCSDKNSMKSFIGATIPPGTVAKFINNCQSFPASPETVSDRMGSRKSSVTFGESATKSLESCADLVEEDSCAPGVCKIHGKVSTQFFTCGQIKRPSVKILPAPNHVRCTDNGIIFSNNYDGAVINKEVEIIHPLECKSNGKSETLISASYYNSACAKSFKSICHIQTQKQLDESDEHKTMKKYEQNNKCVVKVAKRASNSVEITDVQNDRENDTQSDKYVTSPRNLSLMSADLEYERNSPLEVKAQEVDYGKFKWKRDKTFSIPDNLSHLSEKLYPTAQLCEFKFKTRVAGASKTCIPSSETKLISGMFNKTDIDEFELRSEEKSNLHERTCVCVSEVSSDSDIAEKKICNTGTPSDIRSDDFLFGPVQMRKDSDSSSTAGIGRGKPSLQIVPRRNEVEYQDEEEPQLTNIQGNSGNVCCRDFRGSSNSLQMKVSSDINDARKPFETKMDFNLNSVRSSDSVFEKKARDEGCKDVKATRVTHIPVSMHLRTSKVLSKIYDNDRYTSAAHQNCPKAKEMPSKSPRVESPKILHSKFSNTKQEKNRHFCLTPSRQAEIGSLSFSTLKPKSDANSNVFQGILRSVVQNETSDKRFVGSQNKEQIALKSSHDCSNFIITAQEKEPEKSTGSKKSIHDIVKVCSKNSLSETLRRNENHTFEKNSCQNEPQPQASKDIIKTINETNCCKIKSETQLFAQREREKKESTDTPCNYLKEERTFECHNVSKSPSLSSIFVSTLMRDETTEVEALYDCDSDAIFSGVLRLLPMNSSHECASEGFNDAHIRPSPELSEKIVSMRKSYVEEMDSKSKQGLNLIRSRKKIVQGKSSDAVCLRENPVPLNHYASVPQNFSKNSNYIYSKNTDTLITQMENKPSSPVIPFFKKASSESSKKFSAKEAELQQEDKNCIYEEDSCFDNPQHRFLEDVPRTIDKTDNRKSESGTCVINQAVQETCTEPHTNKIDSQAIRVGNEESDSTYCEDGSVLLTDTSSKTSVCHNHREFTERNELAENPCTNYSNVKLPTSVISPSIKIPVETKVEDANLYGKSTEDDKSLERLRNEDFLCVKEEYVSSCSPKVFSFHDFDRNNCLVFSEDVARQSLEEKSLVSDVSILKKSLSGSSDCSSKIESNLIIMDETINEMNPFFACSLNPNDAANSKESVGIECCDEEGSTPVVSRSSNTPACQNAIESSPNVCPEDLDMRCLPKTLIIPGACIINKAPLENITLHPEKNASKSNSGLASSEEDSIALTNDASKGRTVPAARDLNSPFVNHVEETPICPVMSLHKKSSSEVLDRSKEASSSGAEKSSVLCSPSLNLSSNGITDRKNSLTCSQEELMRVIDAVCLNLDESSENEPSNNPDRKCSAKESSISVDSASKNHQ